MLGSIPFYESTLFIHSLVNGYLDCLRFGLLPVSLLRTPDKSLYGYIFSFSLNNTLGWNGWVRWKVYVELFKKLLNYFPKFLTQAAVHESSSSSICLATLGMVSMWRHFIMVLFCISLKTNCVEHLFMCFSIFLGKVSVQDRPQFEP